MAKKYLDKTGLNYFFNKIKALMPKKDELSITENSNGQLQTIGVVDQKTSNVNKFWTGTLAEYNAISTKDENTFYTITDDNSGYITREELLDMTYPIGSIFISVNATDPGILFGGTWERIKDRFLLSAGDTYGAGTTGGKAETIKEITGISGSGYGGITTSNAAYTNRVLVTTASYANSQSSMKTFNQYGLDFLPPYIAVYMWKRVS